MNIKEVKSYYKVTEKIIKEDYDDEIIGIPSLNPHSPRSLKKWNLKKNSNFFYRLFSYFLKLIKNSKNFYCFERRKYDYLIFSHLISYENLNYLNDFYFGKLASNLGKNKVLFVLFDAIGFDKKKINKKIRGNYIILSNSSGLLNELIMHIKTGLKIAIKSFKFNTLKIFKIHNVTSSIDNQRIALKLKNIFKMTNPKKLIYTMEGNPYEWLICKEADEFNKNIFKIGYQFSIIRKLHKSLFINFNKPFRPDHVITIGEYNKKRLEIDFKKKVKVTNVGIIKNRNFSYKKNLKVKKKRINILVMPEGIPYEIKYMLDFCIKNIDTNVNFTFRLHPIYRKKKEYVNLIINSGNKIKISENQLSNDFSKNDFILYRGTAAVIDAINFGLIPIYLKEKDEISVDPLFELNKNHIISYENDLEKFSLNLYKKKKSIKELKNFQDFSKRYYNRFNLQKFNKILKNG